MSYFVYTGSQYNHFLWCFNMTHSTEFAKPIIHSHSTLTEDPDTTNECNSDDNYVPDVFERTS